MNSYKSGSAKCREICTAEPSRVGWGSFKPTLIDVYLRCAACIVIS